ncbi:MAG: VOC family protein [Chloroflexota bacterium]
MPEPLVDNIEAVVAFVPDVDVVMDDFVHYGFSEVFRNGGGDEHISAQLSLGTSDLEFIAPRDPDSNSFFAQILRERPGYGMMSLATPDVDHAVAQMREQGLGVADPMFRKGARRDFRMTLTGRSVTPGVRCMISQYQTPSPRLKGDTPLNIKKLDHVIIATNDLEDALKLWERNVGLKEDTELNHPLGAGFKAARLPIGESFIELVQPVEESGRFYEQVQERGEGLFSISVQVEDLDEAVRYLREKGAAVSDPEPSIWPGARLARINQSSTHGVSIQLIERS